MQSLRVGEYLLSIVAKDDIHLLFRMLKMETLGSTVVWLKMRAGRSRALESYLWKVSPAFLLRWVTLHFDTQKEALQINSKVIWTKH